MARRAASPDPSPPPDEASLHEAALRHLARYATTRAGLRQVLERRIARWERAADNPDTTAEAAGEARRMAERVVEKLAAAGAVDDTAFAEGRARGLARSGVSRRAIAARLAAKGVDADMARGAMPEDADTELASALILARKRRIGPFRVTQADAAQRRRELAILARAGFPADVAHRALATDPDEAEARIVALRR